MINATIDRLSENGMTKEDRYKWTNADRKGEFMWIAKGMLRIDPSYQRTDAISESRISTLVKLWSWIACGCLIVARRPDGSLWVVDGQHRLLAAMKRASILDLPCMVFDQIEIKEEAKAFGWTNNQRGPMPGTSQFKASVVAEDPIACAVQKMIDEAGYRVKRTATAPNTVACVTAMQNCYKISEERCRKIWKLLVSIHNEAPIMDRVFIGAFHLEGELSKNGHSLTDANNRDCLERNGVEQIKRSMSSAAAYYGKGGARVYAQGLADLLNHKRHEKNRIPNLL